jgi:glycosyltransferase involved in cell wall biosynthesis
MNNTSVTVVIPFYNGNCYLDETLDSIEAQSSLVDEVVFVIDNNSEVPRFNRKYSFQIKKIANPEPYNGAGVCRYYGFQEASSRFVAFLDPDDLWKEDKVKKHRDFMLKNELAFSFGGYDNFVDDDGERNIINTIVPEGPYDLDRFLSKSFTIGCLTVLVDKWKVSTVEKNYLKRRNDYMMWFHLLKYAGENSLKWGGFKESLAMHRIHSESLTDSKVKAAFAYWGYLKKLPMTGVNRVRFFVCYVVNTVRERLL